MELVSLRGYAHHRGVSLRAGQKAIASGRIRITTEGKIDVHSADTEWNRNTGPRATTGKPETTGPRPQPIATRMNQAVEPVEPTQS